MRFAALGLAALGVSLAPASTAAQTDSIAVEAVLARSIVDRMPVDTVTAVSADVGTLYLWTRVSGAAGSSISHVWIHGPHEAAVELQVGGSPWRTWSSRTIPPEWTGEWRVEVRDATGRVLTAVSFTVG
jgi:hypothetical protein